MNTTYFTIGYTKANEAYFIGRFDSEEEATATGEKSDADDFKVVGSLDTLKGPELVSIHNFLVPESQRTERFSTKQVGIERTLIAIDSAVNAGSIPAPKGGRKVKAEKPKKEPKAPKPKAEKPKKEPKAKKEGGGRKVGKLEGTVTVLPRLRDPAKRWKANSNRKAVRDWLDQKVKDGIDLEKMLERAGEDLGLSRGVLLGCLVKLSGVKCVKVG